MKLQRIMIFFAFLFLAGLVYSQTIQVTITDTHETFKRDFVPETASDPEWSNTLWDPEGLNPLKTYTLAIPKEKKGQVSGKVIIKPSTVDNYWVLQATPLEFGVNSVKVKLEMFLTKNPNNLNSGNSCYQQTLTLDGIDFLVFPGKAEDWTKIVFGSCGAVARINYVFKPTISTDLKIKDFAIKKSKLGKLPLEGTTTKEPTSISGGKKPFTVFQNAKLNAVIKHNTKGSNMDTSVDVVLTARASDPWNEEGGEQVDFFGPDGEFVLDMAKQNPSITLSINGTNRAWRITAEKEGQAWVGGKKFVNIKIWKNSSGKGSPCMNEKLEFNSTWILSGVPNLTVPLGPWLVWHAKNCGLMFNARVEMHTDIFRLRDIGPTMVEVNKNKKLKSLAATSHAKEVAREAQEKDKIQIKTDKTKSERQAEEFAASGGIIKRYYLRYSTSDLQQIRSKLNALNSAGIISFGLGAGVGATIGGIVGGPVGAGVGAVAGAGLGVSSALSEEKVYRLLFNRMQVTDQAGRQLKKISGPPLFGCKNCMWVNPGIKLDRIILPDGTILGADASKKPAFVLGNIQPGVYNVTYNFPGLEPINLQWTISADPDSPVKEVLVSGENN